MWESWEEAYKKANEEVKDLPVIVATGKKGFYKGRPVVYTDIPVKGNKELINKLKSMGWRSCNGMNVQGKRIIEFSKTY